MVTIRTNRPSTPPPPKRRLWPYGAAVLAVLAGMSYFSDKDEPAPRVVPPVPQTTDTPPPRHGIFDAESSPIPANETSNQLVLDRARAEFEQTQREGAEDPASRYATIRLNHIAAIAYTVGNRADIEPIFFVALNTSIHDAAERAFSKCKQAGKGLCENFSEAIRPGTAMYWAFNRHINVTSSGRNTTHLRRTSGATAQEALDAMKEMCESIACSSPHVSVVSNTTDQVQTFEMR